MRPVWAVGRPDGTRRAPAPRPPRGIAAPRAGEPSNPSGPRLLSPGGRPRLTGSVRGPSGVATSCSPRVTGSVAPRGTLPWAPGTAQTGLGRPQAPADAASVRHRWGDGRARPVSRPRPVCSGPGSNEGRPVVPQAEAPPGMRSPGAEGVGGQKSQRLPQCPALGGHPVCPARRAEEAPSTLLRGRRRVARPPHDAEPQTRFSD